MAEDLLHHEGMRRLQDARETCPIDVLRDALPARDRSGDGGGEPGKR